VNRTKIGILGGMFSPITRGHIDLARFVLDRTDLSEIWIMPCNDHRLKNSLASPSHRLDMCNIACQYFANIRTSDYEIKHELDGSVYNLFDCLFKDRGMRYFDFSFIIGADNVINFGEWKNAEELKKIVRFITAPRKGVNIPLNIDWYKKSPHIYLDEKDPIIEVSSTEIRRLLGEWRNGILSPEKIKELSLKIDPLVLSYISMNNLYRE
jgi:nicotinate (nicotinamide) nucleotide adenylyltransferase